MPSVIIQSEPTAARRRRGPADGCDGAVGLRQVDADAHPRRPRPTEGDVSLAGTDITRPDDTQLTKLRRDHIGFMFQFFNLLRCWRRRRTSSCRSISPASGWTATG